MDSKSLLCKNWKVIVIVCKLLQIQQPASIVFNCCTQWSYIPPSLLNFYSKFCKPNENFQRCKKKMSFVIALLIFHAVDIHTFTKHKLSGSGQNYSWTETTLEMAEDWGTIKMRDGALQKVHNSTPLISLGMI